MKQNDKPERKQEPEREPQYTIPRNIKVHTPDWR